MKFGMGITIHFTFEASNLPVSAILDSGNKSVHALVKVEAESQEEYDERVGEVYALFADHKLDKQNRNASRLSRCPGVPRLAVSEANWNARQQAQGTERQNTAVGQGRSRI